MHQLDYLLIKHPTAVRERGRIYQREGRVRLLHTSPQAVRAQVRGSELYQVDIQFEPSSVRHACSCAAHLDRGKCKHICALAYELKANGYPSLANVGPGRMRAVGSTTSRTPSTPLAQEDWDVEEAGAEPIEHLLADASISGPL